MTAAQLKKDADYYNSKGHVKVEGFFFSVVELEEMESYAELNARIDALLNAMRKTMIDAVSERFPNLSQPKIVSVDIKRRHPPSDF